MLKTYDFVNEQGEKVISKTIQYEKKKMIHLDFIIQI